MHIHNKKTLLVLATLACLGASAQAQTATAPDEEASFTVAGFTVEGESPLAEALTQSTLAPYLGTHNGIERLQQAATALEEVLRSRGFGFVQMASQDEGQKAISEMNGRDVNGRSLVVNEARPRENRGGAAGGGYGGNRSSRY